MNPTEIDRLLKPLTHKELRIQSRARGLNPGGSRETLIEVLKQDMLATKDFAMKSENGEDLVSVEIVAGISSSEMAAGKNQNNYQRSGGQNVGNFITDRPSSRVLAEPGGGSQIVFGDYPDPAPVKKPSTISGSTRAQAPPGGQSQVFFG